MTQYIKKSALVAEIEKCVSNYISILNKVDKSCDNWVESTLMLESKIDALQHIKHFINTLEVKEVDLKKEIQTWVEDNSVNGYYREDVYETAEHFFELGLKTKGE